MDYCSFQEIQSPIHLSQLFTYGNFVCEKSHFATYWMNKRIYILTPIRQSFHLNKDHSFISTRKANDSCFIEVDFFWYIIERRLPFAISISKVNGERSICVCKNTTPAGCTPLTVFANVAVVHKICKATQCDQPYHTLILQHFFVYVYRFSFQTSTASCNDVFPFIVWYLTRKVPCMSFSFFGSRFAFSFYSHVRLFSCSS